MDALRKQLDVLMGANRNGDAQEVTRKYYDRDVCRLFLAGLCPHDLFQLTKMDKGPCSKLHSLQLRREYEEAKAKGLDNYDRDLEDNIDRLIVECDRKISRALKRLDEEDAKAAIAISVTEVTSTAEIIELSKQIKEKLKEADQSGRLRLAGLIDLEGKTDMKIRAMEEVEELRTKRADMQFLFKYQSMLLLDAFNKDRALLPQPPANAPQLAPMPAVVPDPHVQEMINEKLKKAEELASVICLPLIHPLGEQGMVDEAQKLLEEAEALKKLPARQELVLDSSKYTAADVRITDQKLRVCDICGAFLSVYDSDRRLADHFGGKLHLGYMQVREKLAELQSSSIGVSEVFGILLPPRFARHVNLPFIWCEVLCIAIHIGLSTSVHFSKSYHSHEHVRAIGGTFFFCFVSHQQLHSLFAALPYPVRPTTPTWRRETRNAKTMTKREGRLSGEVASVAGNQEMVKEEIAVNVEVIVGGVIVIVIVIVIGIMTVSEREITVLAAMIRGDPAPAPAPEIMIASGVVIVISGYPNCVILGRI
ncbi:LUC7 related protein [Striga asiatica]|uniref:LUC7 related protein n=1 Tax=Striga asiatica TaxID=4170 RepID=A0A5A7QCZ7_STRAF|nr:LUC7 related protein [Striga asiatica]